MEKIRTNGDIFDVDRQAECRKGNYLVGNDQEGYRYAIHNVVDETEPLYHDEEEAWRGLYDRLTETGYEVEYLTPYEELSGGKKLII